MNRVGGSIGGATLSIYFWLIVVWIAFILRKHQIHSKKPMPDFKKNCRTIYLLVAALALNLLAIALISSIGLKYKSEIGTINNDIYNSYLFLSSGLKNFVVPLMAETFEFTLRLKFTEEQLSSISEPNQKIKN